MPEPADIIKEVIHQRGMNPSKALVRIGTDDGQSSLKTVCSIFEPDELENQSKGAKDSGVNKVLILAFVENCDETRNNVKTIMDLINLKPDDIDFVKAQDLKMTNFELGIKSHSSTHACYICDGTKTFESGEIRTFDSIRDNYNRYLADGADKRKAK